MIFIEKDWFDSLPIYSGPPPKTARHVKFDDGVVVGVWEDQHRDYLFW